MTQIIVLPSPAPEFAAYSLIAMPGMSARNTTLEPAKLRETELCYHCGSQNPMRPVLRDEKAFCCDGCATVYGLLKDSRLCDFYSIENHPGKKHDKNAAHYGFLDDEALKKKILDFSDGKTARVSLYIPNVHCSSCIWLLERLHRLHPGVVGSQINFPRKEVHITYSEDKISLREVASLLDAIGYAPHFSLENETKKKPGALSRKQWLQLGIAGFCFGNIMMMAFPEYFGLGDAALSSGFRFINVLLSLPVVTYSAWDYYVSSWKALKRGSLNIDFPIALGFVVIFFRSLADVFFFDGPGFFDSLTGLIFFLLIGKAYQAKTFATLSFDRDYKSYFPIAVTRISDGKEEVTPVSNLKTGDNIRVRNGELIPADSELLSATAQIDYSFVTGEAQPVQLKSGETLYAGGKQAGATIDLRIVKPVSQSYLTRLWNNPAFLKRGEEQAVKWTDEIGKWFTWGVLVIAAVSALYWFPRNTATAWNVLTTILVVACPCVVALATPFALGSVLRYLGRNKLYLRSTRAVENLAKTDAIVFDKTGTLTHSTSADVNWNGDVLTDDDLMLIASLLSHSTHPLSKTVFAALHTEPTGLVTGFEEVKGKGLAGIVDGNEVLAGSYSFAGKPGTVLEEAKEGGEVWIRINGEVKGKFVAGNRYREGIPSLLNQLGHTHSVSVLSGDNEAEHARLAEMAPQGSELLFHQTPEQKLHFVENLRAQGRTVLMAGDGLNDAGALAAADAGISIAEDATAFTPASDGILAAEQLNRLPDFIRFSKASMRVVYLSFIVSFGYNVFGLVFALSGQLTPLMAAILMPASSVTTVLFVTLGVMLMAKKHKM